MANNENTFTAPSVANYQAPLEQEDIAPIAGRPSARTLIILLNQLGAAVRNIECQFGYLHLILPPQLYQSLTQEVVNLPADPGNTPNYVQGADAAVNHTILLNWQLLKGQWQKHVNLNRALIAVTRSNLSANTRQAMQVLFVGGNTNTFLEYFDRLWSRYGRCTPADISQNITSMSAPEALPPRIGPKWSTRSRMGPSCPITVSTSPFKSTSFFTLPRQSFSALVYSANSIPSGGASLLPSARGIILSHS
jgi:hypothetical protein